MSGKNIILSILIVLICGCIQQEKSIRLQYNYKNGEQIRYKLATISKGTVIFTGSPSAGTSSLSPIKMETKIESLITQKVKEVDVGGTAKIEISCDSFAQKIKIGEEEVSLPIEKGRNPCLNFLPDKKINVTIGRDGALLEITGIEEIFHQILTQMPQDISSLPDEFMRKFKEDVEKNMMDIIEKIFPRLPSEEMKVGDSWIQELRHNILFFGLVPGYGKFTYTIEGFKQVKGLRCLQIGIKVMMNFSEDTAKPLFYYLNIPPVEAKFKGKAYGKGTMLFAYQEGKLLSSNLVITTNPEIIFGEEIPYELKINFDTHTLIEWQG